MSLELVILGSPETRQGTEFPIGLEVGFVLEGCDATVEAWSCLCRRSR
jgi:hypothetical protein